MGLPILSSFLDFPYFAPVAGCCSVSSQQERGKLTSLGHTGLPTVPNIGQYATPLGRLHLPPIHCDAPPLEFCSWDF